MMLRKQGALNNQMLRLGCGLPPPVKIPSYVPRPRPVRRRLSRTQALLGRDMPGWMPVGPALASAGSHSVVCRTFWGGASSHNDRNRWC